MTQYCGVISLYHKFWGKACYAMEVKTYRRKFIEIFWRALSRIDPFVSWKMLQIGLIFQCLLFNAHNNVHRRINVTETHELHIIFYTPRPTFLTTLYRILVKEIWGGIFNQVARTYMHLSNELGNFRYSFLRSWQILSLLFLSAW